MSDISPNPEAKVPSHLRDYMSEVMAGLRQQSMDLLVHELMLAFDEQKYNLDEFIDSIAGYAYSQPGWDEVVSYLELASEKISKFRRLKEGAVQRE
jgi:hypothetical protein